MNYPYMKINEVQNVMKPNGTNFNGKEPQYNSPTVPVSKNVPMKKGFTMPVKPYFFMSNLIICTHICNKKTTYFRGVIITT